MRQECLALAARSPICGVVLANPRGEFHIVSLASGEGLTDPELAQLAAEDYRPAGVLGLSKTGELSIALEDGPQALAAVFSAGVVWVQAIARSVKANSVDPLEKLWRLPDTRDPD